MKIAVPDLISNSYFPALAAVELGKFAEQGIDAKVDILFPVNKTYEALRDGAIDCVAGSAHSALAAFPEWKGVKLLCAQGQGMYWFLVMRSDLAPQRGGLSIIKGKRIGAAPWVELGLRQLLIDSGFDLARDEIKIAPVPNTGSPTVNFGLMAAKALEDGLIDGFWANGMGAALAVQSGVGTIVLDIRRGDGPAKAFNYTMASLAVTDRFLAENPDLAAKTIRAIDATHAALKADVSLATKVGEKLFPEREVRHISALIERDLPYYSTTISREFVAGMTAFCRAVGIQKEHSAYEEVVAEVHR